MGLAVGDEILSINDVDVADKDLQCLSGFRVCDSFDSSYVAVVTTILNVVEIAVLRVHKVFCVVIVCRDVRMNVCDPLEEARIV